MGRRVSLIDLAADAVTDTTLAPKHIGVTELAVGDIAPNPLNLRRESEEDPDELNRMAATVGELGMLQPLVVCTAPAFLEVYSNQRGHLDGRRWVALIGNRRLTAARTAGLEHVPAIINNDRLGSMYEVMLVENSNRRDLAPLREAEAMTQVLQREGLSRRDLARRIGRTHPYVLQRLALLSLIPALRQALEDGALTVERARQLGTLSEADQQAVLEAGPPFTRGGNAVTTPRRARALPVGDPAAAARSIRELYSGEDLAELVRLLQSA